MAVTSWTMKAAQIAPVSFPTRQGGQEMEGGEIDMWGKWETVLYLTEAQGMGVYSLNGPGLSVDDGNWDCWDCHH